MDHFLRQTDDSPALGAGTAGLRRARQAGGHSRKTARAPGGQTRPDQMQPEGDADTTTGSLQLAHVKYRISSVTSLKLQSNAAFKRLTLKDHKFY